MPPSLTPTGNPPAFIPPNNMGIGTLGPTFYAGQISAHSQKYYDDIRDAAAQNLAKPRTALELAAEKEAAAKQKKRRPTPSTGSMLKTWVYALVSAGFLVGAAHYIFQPNKPATTNAYVVTNKLSVVDKPDGVLTFSKLSCGDKITIVANTANNLWVETSYGGRDAYVLGVNNLSPTPPKCSVIKKAALAKKTHS